MLSLTLKIMHPTIKVSMIYNLYILIPIMIGNALVDRLVFCGLATPSLRIDSWKIAIQELMKSSGNVDLYQSLVSKLNVEMQAMNIQVMDLDLDWISQTTNRGSDKAEK